MLYKTLEHALPHLDKTLYVYKKGQTYFYRIESSTSDKESGVESGARLLAVAPPCLPALLGGSSFCDDLKIAYPCYAGSMAHGISSGRLVYSMGKHGMLGFLGAAGLSLKELDAAVTRLKQDCAGMAFGVNLLHSPDDKEREHREVDLFLTRHVTLTEASAYILPTPALVQYRVRGIKKNRDGSIFIKNHVIAKVSRLETARNFMEPPPAKILERLRTDGNVTEEEAHFGKQIPLAQHITVEADSGGHTDHRPAMAILPSVIRLAREIRSKYRYSKSPCIGLAGGIGTPAAAAAAFSMGAAYIVTGSVNQACVESGTSEQVREVLARAAQTDITDAPAADMFERGGTVQVLKKGTRFAERARKLYALFLRYESIEDIPSEERRTLEETYFRKPLEEIWLQTQAYFANINPRQIEIASEKPKHKMALIFRWYLGNAVKWACTGTQERIDDYQIWCGPAMGAFNDWVRTSCLDLPSKRSAPVIALNLLYGAAILLRIETLRAQGVPIDDCQLPQPVEIFPHFMKTAVHGTI